MTPPPNFGYFWIIFEGWSQILPATKLFRHEFDQSCSAMATKKLDEKVQQHDFIQKNWMKRYSNTMRMQNQAKLAAGAHQRHKAYEQVPALICDSYARRILCAAAIWGGYFAHRKHNSLPKYLGDKSEIAHEFHHFTTPPPLISAVNTSEGTPPFKPIVSL